MKKILITSLLLALTINVQAADENPGALTPVKIQQANQETQKLADDAVNRVAVLQRIANDGAAAAIADTEAASTPEEIIAAVTAAIIESPDQAAEIVQTAVEANPELANRIVNAAIEAGADPDEMIVAALLGGANEENLEIATAAGGFAGQVVLAEVPTQPGLGGGGGGGGNTASPN